MRAYPNLHPLVARQLGIRLMYAPPLRPARRMLMPIRPLVVRYTHSFPEPCCIRIQIALICPKSSSVTLPGSLLPFPAFPVLRL